MLFSGYRCPSNKHFILKAYKMAYLSLHSPVGDLTVFEEAGAIVALEWGWVKDGEKTPLLQKAKQQLDNYFDGLLSTFSLPINPSGTDFQKRVWNAMCEIPAGEYLSYGDVAKNLTSAAQAVGNACGANPIPIIIPCHRILAHGGTLGGFSGGGESLEERLRTKSALLALEKTPGFEPQLF